MQNQSIIEAPVEAPVYLAVVRELPGFRFYANPYGDTTKYPVNAARFDSPEAAMEVARTNRHSNGHFTSHAGYALLNQNREPMSDEPMVWPTVR